MAQYLRIDDAVPFTTTPSHRIMVPSDGDDVTIKAVDLKLGSWVMCSDDMAKKVKGMRFIHAAGLSCLCLLMSVSACLLGKDVDVEHGELIGHHTDLIVICYGVGIAVSYFEQHVWGANSYIMLAAC